MKNSNNLYKTLFFSILVILLLVGAFFAGIWYNKQQTNPIEKTEIKKSIDKDLSGKITKTPSSSTVQPTVEEMSEYDEKGEAQKAIINSLAAKYDKAPGEVFVKISKYEPSFAQGGVSFAGEMGGGWFLAAEVGGQWVIVDDGNGTITCEIIEPYNFPVSMVSECWSNNSQSIIYR
jgi:hypothetical protein